MSSAFVDFVTLELPRRSPHLTVEIVGYDGDPNLSGAADDLKNAPKGTWYLQETPDKVWWRKQVSGVAGATSWVVNSDQLLLQQVTTGSLSLKVETTGSDAPTATRPARLVEGNYTSEPFLTVQAAIDALPIHLRPEDNVSISIGAGTFDAPVELKNRNGQISISGSVGISSQGTATSGTYSTLTKTGAGWTTNEWRGKGVRITSGPGSGSFLVVVGNTTDTLTVAGRFSAIPTSSSVFSFYFSTTTILNSAFGTCLQIENFAGKVILSFLNIELLLDAWDYCANVENVTVLQLSQVRFYGGLVALRIINTTELIWLRVSFVEGNSFGSNSLEMDNVEKIGSVSSVASVYCLNWVWIQNADVLYFRSWYLEAGLLTEHIRSIVTNLLWIKGTTEYGWRADRIIGMYLQLVDITGCPQRTLDLYNCMVEVSSLTGATGNLGFGLIADRPGVTVDVSGSASITGSLGDASVDGVTALSWSDLISDGNFALNGTTGSRIAVTP